MSESGHALVIEDDKVNSKVLCKYLESLGFETTPCEDVLTALDVISKRPETVVAFVDLNLEPFSGYAFLRALGREPAYRQLKSIMVTGEAKKVAVEAAIQDGARGYLLKPVKLDQLIASLKDIGVSFVEAKEA